jgi:endonuclease/exonuclease/phosphatase (EEP) superfamily protein YafD
VQPPPNFTRLQEALPDYHGLFTYPPADTRELPFGYGLALFSKTPLTARQIVTLPAPGLTFDFFGTETAPTDRVLLQAETVWEGAPITLLNTHLQAFFIIQLSSDDHPGQREAVAAQMQAITGPALLGGDFNTAPGEATVAQLEATGWRTAQRESVTWKRMPYVLDHLFYSPHFALEHVEVRPTAAADHELLLAELSLRAG